MLSGVIIIPIAIRGGSLRRRRMDIAVDGGHGGRPGRQTATQPWQTARPARAQRSHTSTVGVHPAVWVARSTYIRINRCLTPPRNCSLSSAVHTTCHSGYCRHCLNYASKHFPRGCLLGNACFTIILRPQREATNKLNKWMNILYLRTQVQ